MRIYYVVAGYIVLLGDLVQQLRRVNRQCLDESPRNISSFIALGAGAGFKSSLLPNLLHLGVCALRYRNGLRWQSLLP